MKSSPCKGCKDRVPEPNCHSTCEKYLKWYQEEIKTVHENKRKGKYGFSTKFKSNI